MLPTYTHHDDLETITFVNFFMHILIQANIQNNLVKIDLDKNITNSSTKNENLKTAENQSRLKIALKTKAD